MDLIWGFKPYLGYIEKNGNGWINVRINRNRNNYTIWPLPEYLRIHITASEEREEFKILEGRWKGHIASVKKKGWSLGDWDGSYFEWGKLYGEDEVPIGRGFPHTGKAELTYHRRSEKLIVKDLGTFNMITQDSNPLPFGIHDVEIPYEVHKGGGGYTHITKYAKTWFRIGHSGDRFLHCGTRSLGCGTVTDIAKWDKIYKHLIMRRKDFTSVGIIEVLDI